MMKEASKRVILLSHCILNQNASSDSTADFPATFKELIKFLLDEEVGMIQISCPELCCLGLDRGDIDGSRRTVLEENSRIREQLLMKSSLESMEQMVQHLIKQINEYLKNGFTVCGCIGLNRSPSCGVDTTSIDSKEVPGYGVFMDTLVNALDDEGINIPFIGVKTSNIPASLKALRELLTHHGQPGDLHLDYRGAE